MTKKITKKDLLEHLSRRSLFIHSLLPKETLYAIVFIFHAKVGLTGKNAIRFDRNVGLGRIFSLVPYSSVDLEFLSINFLNTYSCNSRFLSMSNFSQDVISGRLRLNEKPN